MIALALIVGLAVWAKLTSTPKEPTMDADRSLDQSNPAWCKSCQSMDCKAPNR